MKGELIKCYCGHTTTCDCEPKEEPKQGALEEFINSQPYYGSCTQEYLEGIKEGAKWQQERMYSEEDLKEAFKVCYTPFSVDRIGDFDKDFEKWFEQFKKK